MIISKFYELVINFVATRGRVERNEPGIKSCIDISNIPDIILSFSFVYKIDDRLFLYHSGPSGIFEWALAQLFLVYSFGWAWPLFFYKHFGFDNILLDRK